MKIHKVLLSVVGAGLIIIGGVACTENDGVRSERSIGAARRDSADPVKVAREKQEQTLSGKVTQASADSLTVEANGQSQQLKLDSSTSVTVDGKRATASQLQQGSVVRASFKVEGGEQRALRIDATSNAGIGTSGQRGSSSDLGAQPAVQPSKDPAAQPTAPAAQPTAPAAQPDPASGSTGAQPAQPSAPPRY